MSEPQADELTVGPDWDIHVGEYTFHVGPKGVRDFARDAMAAPCWVAVGANLVWVGGNVIISPHVNDFDGRITSWAIPDDSGPGLRENLSEFLSGGTNIGNGRG